MKKTFHRLSAPWILALSLASGCDGGGTVSAAGVLSLESDLVDFGEVPVLSSREASLRVCNVGRGALEILRTGISGEGGAVPAGLEVVGAPGTLESGACGDVTLRYRPSALEALEAVLTLETDDSSAPVSKVGVRGVSSTQATIALPESVDFGQVCEGTDSVALAVFSSRGNAPLEIQSASIEGDCHGWFSLVGSSSMPLAVPEGEEGALAVRVSPSFAQDASGSVGDDGCPEGDSPRLVLSTNDSDATHVAIPLAAEVLSAPVAGFQPLGPAAPGAVLALDGTASSASGGGQDGLSFLWTLSQAPADSGTAIDGADEPMASLALDVAGNYEISLVVTDGNGCRSQEVRQAVEALSAEGLRFELFWDGDLADLDLHLVPVGEAFFSPMDCHYEEGALDPDWGVRGDASDDPSLVRDALVGYGPEVISYPSPAPGTYRAMVHYYGANHSLFPSTLATLRTYRFGVLVAEVSRTMERQGDQWLVEDVAWPGGTVSLVAAGGDADGEGRKSR